MTTYKDFLNKCLDVETGYVVAAMTDRYVVNTWPLTEDEIVEEKLLEIRIFNSGMEAKLFRSDISKDFSYRMIDDEKKMYETDTDRELDYSDYYDECQYLDIDTQQSKTSFEMNKMVKTTGGGLYRLPMDKMDDVMVQVRMYFEQYPKTGQARVFDWRIVDFVEERGE